MHNFYSTPCDCNDFQNSNESIHSGVHYASEYYEEETKPQAYASPKIEENYYEKSEEKKCIVNLPIKVSERCAISIDLPPIVWHKYDCIPKMLTITNTGRTILINGHWMGGRPYIEGGPLNGAYIFSQIHFHSPSEHEVEGKRYPLEMHVVHYKSCYLTQEKAMNERDGTIVLVYLFEVMDAETNPTSMSSFTKLAPQIDRVNSRTQTNEIALAQIVQPFTSNYFIYHGSVSSDRNSYLLQWIVNGCILCVTSKEANDLLGVMNYELNAKDLQRMKPQDDILYYVQEVKGDEVEVLQESGLEDQPVKDINYGGEILDPFLKEQLSQQICQEIQRQIQQEMEQLLGVKIRQESISQECEQQICENVQKQLDCYVDKEGNIECAEQRVEPCANPCADPCTNPCADPCTNPCADPCTNPCADPCTKPCTDPCTKPCTDPCTNPCADPCVVEPPVMYLNFKKYKRSLSGLRRHMRCRPREMRWAKTGYRYPKSTEIQICPSSSEVTCTTTAESRVSSKCRGLMRTTPGLWKVNCKEKPKCEIPPPCCCPETGENESKSCYVEDSCCKKTKDKNKCKENEKCEPSPCSPEPCENERKSCYVEDSCCKKTKDKNKCKKKEKCEPSPCSPEPCKKHNKRNCTETSCCKVKKKKTGKNKCKEHEKCETLPWCSEICKQESKTTCAEGSYKSTQDKDKCDENVNPETLPWCSETCKKHNKRNCMETSCCKVKKKTKDKNKCKEHEKCETLPWCSEICKQESKTTCAEGSYRRTQDKDKCEENVKPETLPWCPEPCKQESKTTCAEGSSKKTQDRDKCEENVKPEPLPCKVNSIKESKSSFAKDSSKKTQDKDKCEENVKPETLPCKVNSTKESKSSFAKDSSKKTQDKDKCDENVKPETLPWCSEPCKKDSKTSCMESSYKKTQDKDKCDENVKPEILTWCSETCKKHNKCICMETSCCKVKKKKKDKSKSKENEKCETLPSYSEPCKKHKKRNCMETSCCKVKKKKKDKNKFKENEKCETLPSYSEPCKKDSKTTYAEDSYKSTQDKDKCDESVKPGTSYTCNLNSKKESKTSCAEDSSKKTQDKDKRHEEVKSDTSCTCKVDSLNDSKSSYAKDSSKKTQDKDKRHEEVKSDTSCTCKVDSLNESKSSYAKDSSKKTQDKDKRRESVKPETCCTCKVSSIKESKSSFAEDSSKKTQGKDKRRESVKSETSCTCKVSSIKESKTWFARYISWKTQDNNKYGENVKPKTSCTCEVISKKESNSSVESSSSKKKKKNVKSSKSRSEVNSKKESNSSVESSSSKKKKKNVKSSKSRNEVNSKKESSSSVESSSSKKNKKKKKNDKSSKDKCKKNEKSETSSCNSEKDNKINFEESKKPKKKNDKSSKKKRKDKEDKKCYVTEDGSSKNFKSGQNVECRMVMVPEVSFNNILNKYQNKLLSKNSTSDFITGVASSNAFSEILPTADGFRPTDRPSDIKTLFEKKKCSKSPDKYDAAINFLLPHSDKRTASPVVYPKELNELKYYVKDMENTNTKQLDWSISNIQVSGNEVKKAGVSDSKNEFCVQVELSFHSKNDNFSGCDVQEFNLTMIYNETVLQEYTGVVHPSKLELGNYETVNLLPRYPELGCLTTQLKNCTVKMETLNQISMRAKILLNSFSPIDFKKEEKYTENKNSDLFYTKTQYSARKINDADCSVTQESLEDEDSAKQVALVPNSKTVPGRTTKSKERKSSTDLLEETPKNKHCRSQFIKKFEVDTMDIKIPFNTAQQSTNSSTEERKTDQDLTKNNDKELKYIFPTRKKAIFFLCERVEIDKKSGKKFFIGNFKSPQEVIKFCKEKKLKNIKRSKENSCPDKSSVKEVFRSQVSGDKNRKTSSSSSNISTQTSETLFSINESINKYLGANSIRKKRVNKVVWKPSPIRVDSNNLKRLGNQVGLNTSKYRNISVYKLQNSKSNMSNAPVASRPVSTNRKIECDTEKPEVSAVIKSPNTNCDVSNPNSDTETQHNSKGLKIERKNALLCIPIEVDNSSKVVGREHKRNSKKVSKNSKSEIVPCLTYGPWSLV